jgi:hypothetical protein
MNQFRGIWIFILFSRLVNITDMQAASPADTLQSKINGSEPVKMDFLSSYYQQDGDHSAVTGGEGTEALKDIASVIKINVPLKKHRALQLDTRVNYFTSASSDNIDPKTVSSASTRDFKIGINAAITRPAGRYAPDQGKSKAVTTELGASHEAHFASVNAGLAVSGVSADRQGEWSAALSYIMDVWGQYYKISKLYPSDYYGREELETNKRHTLTLGMQWRRIINPTLKIGIDAGIIQQFGLLSTPFHRIYFSDTPRLDIERLPAYRIRLPLVARLNWYAADWMMVRSSYRFYWDNFELKGHSAYLELPFKPVSQLTVYPFYRYHLQYGHEYFAPYGMHISSETYYTSDFDQSDLQSHFIGGGIRWTPFLPRRQKRNNRFSFSAVELRGGYYQRDNGFHSWIVSGGFSWSILRKKDSIQ